MNHKAQEAHHIDEVDEERVAFVANPLDEEDGNETTTITTTTTDDDDDHHQCAYRNPSYGVASSSISRRQRFYDYLSSPIILSILFFFVAWLSFSAGLYYEKYRLQKEESSSILDPTATSAEPKNMGGSAAQLMTPAPIAEPAINIDNVVLPEPHFNSSCIPTALTSYPGSGSTITRMLIEMSTGVWTGSVYNDKSLYNGKPYAFRGEWTENNVVAIKTHGPFQHQPIIPKAQRAVVMLRNPFSAIPSYYNWYYSFTHKQKMSAHQLQAPQEAWEEWRTDNVQGQITEWVNHLAYWMERFRDKPNDIFVGVFEDLVNQQTGPDVLNDIVDFLDFSNPHVRGVWTKVMDSTSKGIHRDKSYKPQYTEDQRSLILDELAKLKNKLASNPSVVAVLERYMEAGKALGGQRELAASKANEEFDLVDPFWLV